MRFILFTSQLILIYASALIIALVLNYLSIFSNFSGILLVALILSALFFVCVIFKNSKSRIFQSFSAAGSPISNPSADLAYGMYSTILMLLLYTISIQLYGN